MFATFYERAKKNSFFAQSKSFVDVPVVSESLTKYFSVCQRKMTIRLIMLGFYSDIM